MKWEPVKWEPLSRKKVIHPRHLPTTLPVLLTAVVWLLGDRLRWPGWGWGVAVALLALAWGTCVMGLRLQDRVSPREIDD